MMMMMISSEVEKEEWKYEVDYNCQTKLKKLFIVPEFSSPSSKDD